MGKYTLLSIKYKISHSLTVQYFSFSLAVKLKIIAVSFHVPHKNLSIIQRKKVWKRFTLLSLWLDLVTFYIILLFTVDTEHGFIRWSSCNWFLQICWVKINIRYKLEGVAAATDTSSSVIWLRTNVVLNLFWLKFSFINLVR